MQWKGKQREARNPGPGGEGGMNDQNKQHVTQSLTTTCRADPIPPVPELQPPPCVPTALVNILVMASHVME